MLARPDSMRQLLEELRYATLATHNDDGSIHLTPVWFLFDSGRFYVESLLSDRKVRNLRTNPAATIIVDVRESGSERWLYASGTVDFLTDDASWEINGRIARRYLTVEALCDAQVGPVFAAAVDLTIRLTPAHWRSWNLQDMDEAYFDGVLGAAPERWFLPMDR